MASADWGVPIEPLQQVVYSISKARELIRSKIQDKEHLRMEELCTLALIKALEDDRAAAIDASLASSVKYQTAQTKLLELTEQMTKQAEALKMAKSAKDEAAQAFSTANKSKQSSKSVNTKADINKKLPSLKSASSRANAAYDTALRDYNASQSAVQAQTARLFTLEKQLNPPEKFSLEQMEVDIETFRISVDSCKQKAAQIHLEIVSLSDQVNGLIEQIIQYWFDSKDDKVKQIARNFFQTIE
jgi:hypothetical protein